ncbi:hypothetical protein GGG16DRAFT_50766 [Schizophyllum commune]
MGPQTHVIFEVIKSVFDQNQDLLCSGGDGIEAARRLMTKIVNKLATKMELGGPIVAMYLLGNPDHYASHRFKPFFWHTYFRQIKLYWQGNSEGYGEESVLLVKKKGAVVGVSEAQNYTYRGDALENYNLYSFMLNCERVSLPKRQKKEANPTDVNGRKASTVEDIVDEEHGGASDVEDEEVEDDDDPWLVPDDDMDIDDGDARFPRPRESEDDMSEGGNTRSQSKEDNGRPFDEFDDDEPVDPLPEILGEPPAKRLPDFHYPFRRGHSLASSHCMKERRKEDPMLVLNFMRLLPRSDKGNLDEYIQVMLMLFKPWRRPEDLKSATETWKDAFDKHVFSPRQRQLMKNFNLRWECMDARDDYRSKQKSGEGWDDPMPLTEEDVQDIDYDNDCRDHVETVFPTTQAEYEEMNTLYTKKKTSFLGMKDMMVKHRWDVPIASITAPEGRVAVKRTAKNWAEIVQDAKKAAIDAQGVRILVVPENNPVIGPAYVVSVDIVNKALLMRTYVAPLQRGLVDAVLRDFSLNEDQERAVRIAGNHILTPGCGGCSGALRQEFRELELLNEITKLQYEGKLPAEVAGHRRKDLIASFRKWKGETYMPPEMPEALEWTDEKPKYNASGNVTNPEAWLDFEVAPIDWQLITVKDTRGDLPRSAMSDEFVPISNFVAPSSSPPKRSRDNDTSSLPPRKRSKPAAPTNVVPTTSAPPPVLSHGAIWTDNSCAYDCVATLLAWVTAEAPGEWLPRLEQWGSEGSVILFSALQSHLSGGLGPDLNVSAVRDCMRTFLHDAAPATFVPGQYTVLHSVLSHLFNVSRSVATTTTQCKKNASHDLHGVPGQRVRHLTAPVFEIESQHARDVGKWFKGSESPDICSICDINAKQITRLEPDTSFLFIEFDPGQGRVLQSSFSLRLPRQQRRSYVLKGIIYHGEDHFTVRLMQGYHHIWYYDGLYDNGRLVYEGLMSDFTSLRTAYGRRAVALFYAAIDS